MTFPLTKQEHDHSEIMINLVPEMIVAAAVRYGHQIVFVERPARHVDCFISSLKTDDNYDCGFVTNHGRFVSRKEAGEIVLAAGQGAPRPGKSNPNGHLFSEDMWHDVRFEGDFATKEHKADLMKHYLAAYLK